MNQRPEKTYYVFQVQEDEQIVNKITTTRRENIERIYDKELIGSITEIKAPDAIVALTVLGFSRDKAIRIIRSQLVIFG